MIKFTPAFKNSLIFSLAGHLTLFTAFGLSFGNRILSAGDLPRVSFWGDYLGNYQVQKPASDLNRYVTLNPSDTVNAIQGLFRHKQDVAIVSKVDREGFSAPQGCIKPSLAFGFGAQKSVFTEKTALVRYIPRSPEGAMVFHPVLPYDYTLYFKDRLVAHVELEFDIVSRQGKSSVEIRRSITSGNPEVDLLIMRNISHYLSMQQKRFSPNSWQTVKIDLSQKK
jgi:hypothetical protein